MTIFEYKNSAHTLAMQVASLSNNSTEAMEIAQKSPALIDTDQDWDNETTIFTFKDDSCLAVSGSDFKAI